MAVSGKVALENIQNEAHTTEAKKFVCPMSPSPYHGPVPRTWADACNMGPGTRALTQKRAQGARDPRSFLGQGPGPGPNVRPVSHLFPYPKPLTATPHK